MAKREALRAATGGVIIGVLGSLALEAATSPTEDDEWLMPIVFLALPLALGVMSALWAGSRLRGEQDRHPEIYALALYPIFGWGAGFATAHAVVGTSAVRRGVGTAVIAGIFAALTCSGTVALLEAGRRRPRRNQTTT